MDIIGVYEKSRELTAPLPLQPIVEIYKAAILLRTDGFVVTG